MVKTSVTWNANKLTNEKIQEASDWLSKRLMGNKLAGNIGIEIIMSPNLKRKKDAQGLFYCVDSITSRPREFEIELDSSLATSTIIQCLCHEMVHVKQSARLELRDNDKSSKFWNGKLINTDKTDYWELPWEIEAHGRERGLYLNLMDHFDTIGL